MAFIYVMICYFLVMISIGLYHSRTSKDIEGYYLAGRNTNQFFQTMTNFATVSSSFTMMGALGFAYGHGFCYVWLGWLWTSLYVLLWLIFGSRGHLLGRKFNWMTGNDIVRDYFGFEKFQIVVTLILVMVQFPYIIAQMLAVGYLFNVFSGIPIEYGVAAAVFMLTVYGFLGGVKTVLWGDAMAGIIIMSVLALLFFTLLPKTMAQGPVIQTMLTNFPNHFTFPGALGTWTPLHAITYVIAFGTGYAFIPKFINRWFTPASYKVMRLSVGKSNGIVNIFTWFICPMIGIMMLSIMPGMEKTLSLDMIPPQIIWTLLPVLGIVYALSVAAGSISTADSAMITCSSMLLKDIYARLFAKEPSDAHLLWAGRVCTLLIGLVAMFFTLTDPGYIILIVGMSAAMGSIVLFCFILGPLMVPWITRAASMWASVISSLFCFFSLIGVLPKTYFGLPGTTITCFLCLALVVIISAFTEKVDKNIQKEFHGYLDDVLTPLDEKIGTDTGVSVTR